MPKLAVALAVLCLVLPACVTTRPTPMERAPTAPITRRPPLHGPKNLNPPPWLKRDIRREQADSYPREWMPRRLSRRWSTIVIHHSATASGGAKAFDAYHKQRGWNGLGYHFVIGNGTDTADGQVEVGARWRQQSTGAHCKTPNNYYNEHGIGICLVGDFTRSRPTPKQMASLRKLTRFLAKTCGIAPTRVTTHRNVTGGTACPGRHFHLDTFRSALVEDHHPRSLSGAKPALEIATHGPQPASRSPSSAQSYGFAHARAHGSH